MVDIMAIQGAISGLKTAADLAKGLIQLKSTADMQVQVIELQSAILAAQSNALAAQADQFTMIQRIRELEEEIARIKAWEEEKKRYQLVNPWQGAASLVYAVKESCKGAEPPHWICAKCYDDGRRTILQPKYDDRTYLLLFCATCKSDIHSGLRGVHRATYAPG